MFNRSHALTMLVVIATLAVIAPRSPAPAAATAGTAAAPAAAAQIPPWGLDLTARDPSVKPGDDFYHYANGHWLDTHSIPPDRTRWGAFDALQERSLQQVRDILE
jgi:putative endopeptidase